MTLQAQDILAFAAAGPGDRATFTGATPVDILRAMQAGSMFTWDLGLDEYMSLIRRNTKQLLGIDQACEGEDVAERAASIVDAMVGAGLLAPVPPADAPDKEVR